MEKKHYYILGFLVSIITVTGIVVNHIKSNIDYANVVCTECMSDEVLNLGEDQYGNVHCMCFDCKHEFYINETVN